MSSARSLLLRRILAPRGSQPKSVLSHFPSVQRTDLQGQLRVESPTFAKLRRMTETSRIDEFRSLMGQGRKLFGVSTLSGACVLYVLVRHLMA